VHRDIKPENVLLRDDGTVKVVDFGLARAVTANTASADASVIFGTAAYLSPEQVDAGTASERSDVYAVGLLVFEMLCGVKAFPGDSPIHVAYQHVHGQVPRASDTVETVPSVLDEFIAHTTSTDPAQRPADAAEMLEYLNSVRDSLQPEELDAVPERENRDEEAEVAHTSKLGIDSTHALGHHDGSPTPPYARRRALVAVVGVLLLALIAVGVWVFAAGPLAGEQVPDVAGKPQGVAIAAIQDAHLGASVREIYSETVLKGSVIRTLPDAGTKVRRSDSVVLQVSRGPERHVVPSLSGDTQPQAEAALKDARLAVGPVTKEYSETVPPGRVISSDPGVNESLKSGAQVSLVVSKGRQPIVVPSVVGKSSTEATTTLNGLGFTVQQDTQQFSDTVALGNIISQTPASGTGFRGDGITLVVSKGPQLIAVPDVTGKTSQQARSQLEALGLKVKIERFFGGLFNDVRATNPTPGTKVRKGTMITLSVV
ncbi:MAG: PASTA domain-containing protein, partial [Allobranchiibius sp.]